MIDPCQFPAMRNHHISSSPEQSKLRAQVCGSLPAFRNFDVQQGRSTRKHSFGRPALHNERATVGNKPWRPMPLIKVVSATGQQ
jgi:hypothetical protein